MIEKTKQTVGSYWSAIEKTKQTVGSYWSVMRAIIQNMTIAVLILLASDSPAFFVISDHKYCCQ
jgi:hypothetical protein